jgi:hypothetical protein
MQRYTVYLYLETALHVSGGTFTHHQEGIHLYLQHLVFVTSLLLSGCAVHCLPDTCCLPVPRRTVCINDAKQAINNRIFETDYCNIVIATLRVKYKSVHLNSMYCMLCMLCSVYSVFIVPTGILRLPWLRISRAFSSDVRQMPGYNLQRRGTARTISN